MATLDASATPQLDDLLRETTRRQASDLHLSTGCPPLLRIDGVLQATTHPVLSAEHCSRMLSAIAGNPVGETRIDLDTALTTADGTRFRVNLFRQNGNPAAVFRRIAGVPPTLAELQLPDCLSRLVDLRDGLILVTGATGSGKSTTLAALVAEYRHRRGGHVLTIEDPIEFLHPRSPGLINQREVGRDTPGFAAALRQALRQDPDAVLVGELRDRETLAAALTLAETGHLVFSTLHSTSAAEAPDRMISAFGADEQPQVRQQVATVLQAVVAQRLLPHRSGTGRVAACEVLVGTPAIRNLIREGKTHQIPSMMQAGRRATGMQTMTDAIQNLVDRGLVADPADSDPGSGRTAPIGVSQPMLAREPR